ncbi:War1p [Sugiyamaella lignohabitans]|uniref:War1p n=1 Tax=Sugiyamaella lignohabitans TaxID=796027 RepID=A0A167E1N1_9ASCO|nr:War1p [Sugiyamaella lignohabitans]ANB13540.1 War1p [Sugiyamaella lignohabitans]
MMEAGTQVSNVLDDQSRLTPMDPMASSSLHSAQNSDREMSTQSPDGASPKSEHQAAPSTRRSKACSNCRALKVRCINSDPDDPSAPCVRCKRGHKVCVFNLGPRKRTKKTDTRVAVLEKKLELLSAALHEQNNGGTGPSSVLVPKVGGPSTSVGSLPSHWQGQSVSFQPTNTNNLNGSTNNTNVSNSMANHHQNQTITNNNQTNKPASFAIPQQHQVPPPPPMTFDSIKRTPSSTGGPITPEGGHYHYVSPGGNYHKSSLQTYESINSSTPDDFELTYTKDDNSSAPRVDTGVNVETMREEMLRSWTTLAERSNKRLELLSVSAVPKVPKYETDVVANGILSEENAQARLDMFRNVVYPVYPIMVLPDDLTVEQFRREKPLLFLCVMSMTSMVQRDPSQFESSLALHNAAYEAIIYETMVLGSMTFELLQCLILLTYWYNEPEFYHRQKSHILANLAVTIAQDLGISGGTVPSNPATSLRFEKIVTPNVLIDSGNLECRKLWLLAYSANMNVLTASRKSPSAVWSDYNDECCQLIQNSKEVPIADKRIANISKLAHVFEDISKAFYTKSKEQGPPNLSDMKTKFLLIHFEHRLGNINKSAKRAGQWSPSFDPYYHSINAYLHQAPLYVKYSASLGRSPFSEYSLAIDKTSFSQDEVECILECHTSAVKALEIFNSFGVEQYAMLPMFNYTRLVFCASILLKTLGLSMCNKAFRDVCRVPAGALSLVYGVLDRLTQVNIQYPFSNSATCFSFVIKLLLCHFDGQVQYFLCERNVEKRNIPNLQVSSQANSMDNQMTQQQQNQVPMQPLQTVGQTQSQSQAQQAQMQQSQSQAQAQNPNLLYPTTSSILYNTLSGVNGSNGVPNNVNLNNSIPGSPLEVLSAVALDPNQRRSAEPPNTDVNPPKQRSSSAEEEEYPVWFVSDDFWKDLVPNVEAFSGYDMM